MWDPTHVKVTVIQARNLLEKKSKGNDVYVVISLGKEKYRTSVQEQTKSPYWNEECDLVIPQDRKPLKLKVYHRSLSALASDDFLGQALIPIQDIDMDAQPRPKWFTLESKPSKKNNVKERGELEVKISFIVKSQLDSSKLSAGPLGKRTLSSTSIGKKKKHSGSLLSLSKKATSGSVRNLASSVGKVFTLGRKKDKNKASADCSSVTSSIDGRDIDDLDREINTNPFEMEDNFEKNDENSKKSSPSWGRKNNGDVGASTKSSKESNSSRRVEMNGTKDCNNDNKATNGKKSPSNSPNESKFSLAKEIIKATPSVLIDNSEEKSDRGLASNVGIQAVAESKVASNQTNEENISKKNPTSSNNVIAENDVDSSQSRSARGSFAKLIKSPDNDGKKNKSSYVDLSRDELINLLIAKDEEIDTYRVKVDDLCAKLMTTNPALLEIKPTRPVTRGHRVSTSCGRIDFS